VGRRTRARECAFQILYQWDMTRDPIDHVVESFWKVRSTTDLTRSLADRLARGAQQDVERIDAEIVKVSKNWRFDRIAAVDRNIIRLGAFELIHDRDTPAAVVIDEAVEMARRFGEADSTAFVNGVLDAIKRGVREGKSVGRG
jgi:N utilization substance protein B